MKKSGFLATELGRQVLAALMILISLPTVYCGVLFEQPVLNYLGVGIVLVGLGIAPVTFILQKCRKK